MLHPRQFPLPIPIPHSLHSVPLPSGSRSVWGSLFPRPPSLLMSPDLHLNTGFMRSTGFSCSVDPEPLWWLPYLDLSLPYSFIHPLPCSSSWCQQDTVSRYTLRHLGSTWQQWLALLRNSLSPWASRQEGFFVPFPPPWWLLPKLSSRRLFLCPFTPSFTGSISILLTSVALQTKNSKFPPPALLLLSSDYTDGRLRGFLGCRAGRASGKLGGVGYPRPQATIHQTWELRYPTDTSSLFSPNFISSWGSLSQRTAWPVKVRWQLVEGYMKGSVTKHADPRHFSYRGNAQ